MRDVISGKPVSFAVYVVLKIDFYCCKQDGG